MDAAAFWDKNLQVHSEKREPVNWMDSYYVWEAMPKLPGGYSPDKWLLWIKDQFHDLECGLSICSGDGSLERNVLQARICKRMDAYDISPRAIEFAQQKANGLPINYVLADLNSICLPRCKYDIVFSGSALHHIGELEHVLEEIALSLKPDGIFAVNDYVGPSQFQWTEKQLMIMNDILSILPERLRKDPISRIPIEVMNANDPSEAIRSGEIMSILAGYFRIIERVDYGGTLLHALLQGIIGKFRDDDLALLKLICYMERLLIAENVLSSDHVVAICKKRN